MNTPFDRNSTPPATPQVTGKQPQADMSNLTDAELPARHGATLQYATEVFTGVRPTGSLTIANYLGALAPVVELQAKGLHPLVFVADIHAYTDNEPGTAVKHTEDVITACLAGGLDPTKSNIFIQSSIASEVYEFSMLLMRHMNLSELARVPTIKDKIEDGGDPLSINLMLAMYPVMMASDILLQRAKCIPTGQDQIPHLELTQRLARRFNDRYGDIIPIPHKMNQEEALRLRSLDGSGKMSKSKPDGAIFLTDTPDQIRRKIKSAKTGFAGAMNEDLVSMLTIGKALSRNGATSEKLGELMAEHVAGKPVMGSFKKELAEVVVSFVEDFQSRRREIQASKSALESALETGTRIAHINARETLDAVRAALGL